MELASNQQGEKSFNDSKNVNREHENGGDIEQIRNGRKPRKGVCEHNASKYT